MHRHTTVIVTCLIALLVAWFALVFVFSVTGITCLEITERDIHLDGIHENIHRGPGSALAPTEPSTAGVNWLLIGGIIGGVLLLALVGFATLGGFRSKDTHEPVAAQSIVDEEARFRLNHPRGWQLIPRAAAERANPLARAGAVKDHIRGTILVQNLDQPANYRGQERRIAEAMIRSYQLVDVRTESIDIVTHLGHRAFQYRIVGTEPSGVRMRYQNRVIPRNRRVYQIVTAGPVDETDDAGSRFEPFVRSFALLPDR